MKIVSFGDSFVYGSELKNEIEEAHWAAAELWFSKYQAKFL